MTTNPRGSPLRSPSRRFRPVRLAAVGVVVAWGGVALAQITPPQPPPKAAPPEGVPMPGAPVIEEPVAGSEVEVVLRDGRRETGFLVERDAAKVTITANGVPVTFDAATVARVVRIPTIDERYKLLRDAIDPDDVESIVQLAEWLRGRGRLDLALWEVERALLLDPSHARGRELKVQVVAQQKVNEARRAPAPGVTPDPDAAPRFVFPVLDAEQVNLIKVYEVDLRDPPSMLVPPDVTRRFLSAYAGRDVEGLGTVPTSPEAKEAFLRQRPADILAWLFAARAREFYGQVRVRETPRALRDFVRDVHNNWLINSCATSKCHGGEDAGRLFLNNFRAGNEASALTNFLILDRFKTADGLGLIDYEQPERSPLLDFGLPRDQAVFKHPVVPESGTSRWRPVFRGRDDERYHRAVEWIKGMYKPRVGYPIEYDPPTPPAKAAPPAAPPGR